jgi:hypothetical protein
MGGIPKHCCTIWGLAVCMGILGKMAKSRRRKSRKSYVSIVFSMNGWPKNIPKRSDNQSDRFEPVSASLDHSQPILHLNFETQKKMQKTKQTKQY